MYFFTNKRVSYKNKSDLTEVHGNSYSKNKRYIFEKYKKEIINYSTDLRIETVNNFKDFQRFYKFPFRLYKDDQYWIPPFWMEYKDFFKTRNPFWNHSECKLFIAMKKNNVIGRIAAIIDYSFCENNNKKIGYFGFFECIDDFKVANSLFLTTQNWLNHKGITIIRGPIDGRIDIGCGFLYSGFNSTPCLLTSYSPEYYITFVERFGMEKIRDQFSYNIDLTKPIPKKLKEKAQKCSKSGVKIRPFSRLHTRKELKWWIELFLQTFSDHWGYVPVSIEEVKSRFGVKQLRWIVDPKLFLVAEIDGVPVAYLWSTPDYNQIFKNMDGKLGPIQIFKFLLKKNRLNKGKLHFIGIKKECRNQNIASYLNYETLLEMKKRGYTSAEAVIDEGNDIAQTTIAITGAKVIKKFRVFEKKLLNP